MGQGIFMWLMVGDPDERFQDIDKRDWSLGLAARTRGVIVVGGGVMERQIVRWRGVGGDCSRMLLTG